MKTVIIGAGAAGMMAAYSAAMSGSEVLIIEKNEKPGKKLFITGKGRCNVTNASDAETFFNNVNTNPKFLYSAFYSFDNDACMNFFENAGCELKVERGNRVFPQSDKSSDIIKAIYSTLVNMGVKFLFNVRCLEIKTDNGSVSGVLTDKKGFIKADKVILATGGKSYPLTGSTGDGYEMAEKLGHSITDICPSLVPINCSDAWIPDLMGISLKNVEFVIVSDGKVVFKEMGEMLFTHFGVSGPLVLSASSFFVKERKKGRKIEAYIDLKPALTMEMLDKRILKDFEKSKNKALKNSLDELLLKKLISPVIELSNIDRDKKVNEISKKERRELCAVIKKLPIHLTVERDISEAIITCGGINVKEINASTMESKLVKGLFLAGEIIDIDAMTGGYNLQIAWSTGYLAGLTE